MFLSNTEGIGEVMMVVALVQLCEVDEVRSVIVDESVKAQSTLPGFSKVSDVHILITLCYDLAPMQQDTG